VNELGRRSWIHLMYSKQDYERLHEGIKENELIFEVGSAILNGQLHCVHGERTFGEDGKKSLVVLTQSDGSVVIDELIDAGAIADRSTVFFLDDVDSSFLEDTKNGTRIKNLEYFTTLKEFEQKLNVFEENEEFNNTIYQARLRKKADGLLYMCYFCRVVIGIFGFCQEQGKSDALDSLFQQAQGIVDDLGYWYHLESLTASYIVADVENFIRLAHKVKNSQFKAFIEYAIQLGTNLITFLSKLSQEEESISFESKAFKAEAELLLWQLGELKVRIMDRSQMDKEPIPYQPFVALKELFISFGKWIYGNGDEATILIDADRVSKEIRQWNFTAFKQEFSRVSEINEHIIDLLT
jgi:hypothetical protein